MKTAIVSLHYFPNISFFSLFSHFDKVIIDTGEHYSKQSYRNRCKIAQANGAQDLSIPVVKKSGQKQQVKDVAISYDTDWQHLHWHALKSAYRSSPFYEYYIDDLEFVFNKKHESLCKLNLLVFEELYELLGVEGEYEIADEYVEVGEGMADLRPILSPKHKEKVAIYHSYHQVFSGKYGFMPNLSVLDLLFNEGPGALEVIDKTELLNC